MIFPSVGKRLRDTHVIDKYIFFRIMMVVLGVGSSASYLRNTVAPASFYETGDFPPTGLS
jgi:hypothetical protein